MPRSTSTASSRSASAPRRLPDAGIATAVVAAAGSGSRLGAGGPKALVEVAGRPLLAWSLDALAAAESVGLIVIAAPPGGELALERLAGDAAHVVTGGATRSESVAAALAIAEGELVVVHDAARPLATSQLFDEVVSLLASDPTADAVIAAAPVPDTVKRTRGERLEVTETVDRDGLWAVQTPQAFRAETLRRALDVSADELTGATDDAMLVERAGGKVLIHPSPAENLKVTTPHDLRVAELLLRAR